MKYILILFITFSLHAQDKKYKSALFLGDSNTARYGETMEFLLKSIASEVSYYGLPGAAPQHFSQGGMTYYSGEYIRASGDLGRNKKSPKIEDLQKEHNPDLYVVALAGNLIGQSKRKVYTDDGFINVTLEDLRGPNYTPPVTQARAKKELAYVSWIKKKVKGLLDKIPEDKDCVWVGAPKGADTHLKPQFFFDAMEEELAKHNCKYIDGRVKAFVGNGKDPVHYTMTAAQDLARKVFFGNGTKPGIAETLGLSAEESIVSFKDAMDEAIRINPRHPKKECRLED